MTVSATRTVEGYDLQVGMQLVGSKGGRSQILRFGEIFGFAIVVDTEHGRRLLDLDRPYRVAQES